MKDRLEEICKARSLLVRIRKLDRTHLDVYALVKLMNEDENLKNRVFKAIDKRSKELERIISLLWMGSEE